MKHLKFYEEMDPAECDHIWKNCRMADHHKIGNGKKFSNAKNIDRSSLENKVPLVKELLYDLEDIGFKTVVKVSHMDKNGFYSPSGKIPYILVYVGRENNEVFDISKVKENLLFAESYAEEELGLNINKIRYADKIFSSIKELDGRSRAGLLILYFIDKNTC